MEKTIIEFLEWMDKINSSEPMKLETDNKDLAKMFLAERKSNSDRADDYTLEEIL